MTGSGLLSILSGRIGTGSGDDVDGGGELAVVEKCGGDVKRLACESGQRASGTGTATTDELTN